MSDHKNYRTKDEWFAIIKECRKSGMTDARWCLANGVNHHSFYNAIKRLRKCSYAIPEKQTNDIFDITLPQKQDVVKVDIVNDATPAVNNETRPAQYIDNSHMIDISIGDIHVSLNNGADPTLVSKTLSILRSFL